MDILVRTRIPAHLLRLPITHEQNLRMSIVRSKFFADPLARPRPLHPPNGHTATLSRTRVKKLPWLVTKKKLQVLLAACSLAIRNVFYISLALFCLAFMSTFPPRVEDCETAKRGGSCIKRIVTLSTIPGVYYGGVRRLLKPKNLLVSRSSGDIVLTGSRYHSNGSVRR